MGPQYHQTISTLLLPSGYFPTLKKGYLTLLFHHTSNTSTSSILPLPACDLATYHWENRVFPLEPTPASLLNPPSTEITLVNVTNDSTLLNPMVNSQSSSYSPNQQHLSHLIMHSDLAPPSPNPSRAWGEDLHVVYWGRWFRKQEKGTKSEPSRDGPSIQGYVINVFTTEGNCGLFPLRTLFGAVWNVPQNFPPDTEECLSIRFHLPLTKGNPRGC